jgi:hemerythrin-like domain-containing protein
MHHAIDTLRHEHEAITLGLKILARMDQRITAEQITDILDLSTLTHFLKAFADTCHHGKEEGILFPAMQAEDPAQTRAPIERMLDEHAQGRRHLADMQAALHPEVNLPEFHTAARAYTSLLLAHIDKENTVLFPMAERLFSGEQQTQMAQAFDAYEDKVMGPGQHEALHNALKTLRAKYPD